MYIKIVHPNSPENVLDNIDLSYNDVKCGFEMLREIWQALEKCRANQI